MSWKKHGTHNIHFHKNNLNSTRKTREFLMIESDSEANVIRHLILVKNRYFNVFNMRIYVYLTKT